MRWTNTHRLHLGDGAGGHRRADHGGGSVCQRAARPNRGKDCVDKALPAPDSLRPTLHKVQMQARELRRQGTAIPTVRDVLRRYADALTNDPGPLELGDFRADGRSARSPARGRRPRSARRSQPAGRPLEQCEGANEAGTDEVSAYHWMCR